jgi:hypothetical protein
MGARQDSTLFVEVKCIFSTTPEAEFFSKESWIETGANGGHWHDRTLNRTWSRHDRTRPVSSSNSLAHVDWGLPPTRLVTRGTGASDQVPEELRCTRGRSDVVARPVTIDRTHPVVCGCLLESTGRWHCGVRSIQAVRPVAWSATRIVTTGRRDASDQF